jgi:hypothetical protein
VRKFRVVLDADVLDADDLFVALPDCPFAIEVEAEDPLDAVASVRDAVQQVVDARAAARGVGLGPRHLGRLEVIESIEELARQLLPEASENREKYEGLASMLRQQFLS